MTPGLVLLLTLVYLVVVLLVRTLAHWRRTGSTGFHGVSGRFGSLEWWGGALFVAGIVLAIAAPMARLFSVDGLGALVIHAGAPVTTVVGGVLFAFGFAATYRSQSAMGRSWRIGVDSSERTDLVSAGAFRFVRNPIFTSMLVTGAGLFLLLPTVLSLAAWMTLLAAIELQVRVVEEPYLIGTHGDAYRAYARGTGRFLPGLGLWK